MSTRQAVGEHLLRGARGSSSGQAASVERYAPGGEEGSVLAIGQHLDFIEDNSSLNC